MRYSQLKRGGLRQLHLPAQVARPEGGDLVYP